MQKLTAETIFQTLIGAIFFLPLIFWIGFWTPFASPKAFVFLSLIDIGLPLYLFLLWKYPNKRPDFKNPFLISLTAFICFEILAAVFGRDPLNSFLGEANRADGLVIWMHVFLFVLYLLLALRLDARPTTHPKHIAKKYLRLFLSVAGITALIGCLQATGVIPFMSTEFDTRVTSTLGNPIFLAATLVIPFFLSLHESISEKHLGQKYFYGIISALCLLAIIFSQTRGAFVGLAAGAIVCVIVWFAKKHPTKKMLFVSIALFVTCVGGFFLVRSTSHFGSTDYRLTHFTGANTNSRLAFWNYAIEGWKQSPWLGNGHENFYLSADKYFQSSLYASDSAWPDKPHNAIIEILATGGIFSCLAYLCLFLFAIVSILRRKDQPLWQTAYVGALTAYFIQNLFIFDTVASLENIAFLFVLMVYTVDTPMTNNTKPVPRLIWLTGIIPIGFICLWIPVMQEMYTLNFAAECSAADCHTALTQLEHISHSNVFVYDAAAIGLSETRLGRTELETKNPDVAFAHRAFMDAQASYAIAVAQHPLRAEYAYRSSFASYLDSIATGKPVSQDARNLAIRAHTLAPNRIEPLISLSNIYDTNNDSQNAILTATQALHILPNDPNTLWNLALIYVHAENLDEATKFGFQSVQQNLKPTTADALSWLFDAEIQKHETKNAIIVAEKMVAREPDNLNLLPKLATAYAMDGQKEKAIATAQELLRRAPDSAAQVNAFIKTLRIPPPSQGGG